MRRLSARVVSRGRGALAALRRRKPPAAWLPVAAVVAFTGWHLRAELSPGHYPHDGSFHLAYLEWATNRLSSGHSPLDGIFPDLGLGFPVFQHYQVVPYIVTAPVAWLFGVDGTYATVLFLLLALWPACVYGSARLLELDRRAAAGAAVAAAFVVSQPGYGFELGSYVWRGSGMWTQAWGMWLFALAIACAWRAVFRRRSLALAAGLLAATLTSHLLTGLLAVAVVLVWALAGGPRAHWRQTATRTAAVVLGGVLASSWLLVPAYVDRGATFFDNPGGTFWRDSFGAGPVWSWLWRGEIFDAGRLPVLTLLVAVGVVVLAGAAWRRPGSRAASERAVLLLAGVSLVLFFGSSVVGPLVDRLPGREVVYLHRMIVGVHFGGILLAGAGAAVIARAVTWLMTTTWERLIGLGGGSRRQRGAIPRPLVAASVAGLGVILLAPAWTQTARYLDESASMVDQQRAWEAGDGRDFAALVGIAQTQGGRLHAGTRGAWGEDYRIGFIPAYIELLNLGSPGVGFSGRVPALTERSEAVFSGDVAGQSEAFDVRWHIRPASMQSPPNGALVATRGRHRLWRVPTTGPVTLIDTTPALVARREDAGVVSASFMGSTQPLSGSYPLLALDGARLPAATQSPGASGSLPNLVSDVTVDEDGNRYAAMVEAPRRAAVLVKTTYHPRWRAEVDGRAAATMVVAPGLLAAEVPAGRHEVAVRYTGVPGFQRALLVALGVAALVTLARIDRRSRRGGAAIRPRSWWWRSRRPRTAWSPSQPPPAGQPGPGRDGGRSPDGSAPRPPDRVGFGGSRG